MANTSSAKKAQRGSVRKYVFNARRKKAMKDAVKEIGKLIGAKSGKDAAAALPAIYHTKDNAAKNGPIKKNAAARMKPRLTKRAAAPSK